MTGPATDTGSTGSALQARELRDLALVERGARDVLRHCEYLRRNGAGDETRFGLIASIAWGCWRAAARADRRAAVERGWYRLKWRLPRGYDQGGPSR